MVLGVDGEGVGGMGDWIVGYERTARASLSPINQYQKYHEYDPSNFVP